MQWLVINDFLNRSVLQTGVLQRLVFLKKFLWLDVGGRSSATLWFLLLTIPLNSFLDNSSRLEYNVVISTFVNASLYFKSGKTIRMARF